MQTTADIVAAIADSESQYRDSPEQYAGFVRKVTKTRIDFHWARAEPGKPDEMTITRRGVIASRTLHEGRNWYGYTLDPFGAGVAYSDERQVAYDMLKRFNITQVN